MKFRARTHRFFKRHPRTAKATGFIAGANVVGLATFPLQRAGRRALAKNMLKRGFNKRNLGAYMGLAAASGAASAYGGIRGYRYAKRKYGSK